MPIFEMFDAREAWPVTVFAPDRAQAMMVYADWVSVHQPDWSTKAMSIGRYDRETRSARILSDSGHDARQAGVGVWDDRERAWRIVSAKTAGDRNLFMPDSEVRYYRVSDGDEELMVFARSAGKAVSYFEEWYADAMGFKVNTVIVTEHSRWRLVQDLVALRDSMHAGERGVARWDEDHGWSIVEPEDGEVVRAHLR
ncbi:MAG: hypothetical protein WA842_13380 [Croceibacterium sp.]